MDSQLQGRIITGESFRSSVYQDIYGYWTLGYGTCVDEKKNCGITKDEGLFLLNNRVNTFIDQLKKYSWYNNQDPIRQGVLIELCYTMGVDGLLGFAKSGGMIDLMTQKKYDLASQHLLASKWAHDVKSTRALDVANRLKYGKY